MIPEPSEDAGAGPVTSEARCAPAFLPTAADRNAGCPAASIGRNGIDSDLSDGKEVRRKREKIITRELAETHRIANDYTGPVTKTDAQRVLDLLIAADSGRYIAPNTEATAAMVAKEYLALSNPTGDRTWCVSPGN